MVLEALSVDCWNVVIEANPISLKFDILVLKNLIIGGKYLKWNNSYI